MMKLFITVLLQHFHLNKISIRLGASQRRKSNKNNSCYLIFVRVQKLLERISDVFGESANEGKLTFRGGYMTSENSKLEMGENE